MDLKQGYHRIDIDKNYQKYLGFVLENDGKIRYFISTVSPFGLCWGPFIFTEIMLCPIKFRRREGINIYIYQRQSEIRWIQLISVRFCYKFWKTTLATTKRAHLAGHTNNFDKIMFHCTWKLIAFNYGLHPIHNLPYTRAWNLFKRCKIISTIFVIVYISSKRNGSKEIFWAQKIALKKYFYTTFTNLCQLLSTSANS